MAEETVREFLGRRIREISHRLEHAKGVVASLENELRELQAAQTALKPIIQAERRDALTTILNSRQYMPPPQPASPESIATADQQSIRVLVLTSFRNPAFNRYGATNAELRQYISDTTGREIERTSLSPALTRLKEEGVLVSDDAGKWRLAKGVTIKSDL